MNIVILGAGIAGVTAAYFLAKDGHDVVVIDRQPAAGLEASFANGGQLATTSAGPWARPAALKTALKSLGREDAPLIMRLRADPAMWTWCLRFLRNCTTARLVRNTAPLLRLSLHARAMLDDLIAETNIDIAREKRGILDLVYDARALEREARHAGSETCEVVEAARCLEIEPALAGIAGRFAGGLYFPQDQSGDAYLFTTGLADACLALGVEFRYGVDVTGIESRGGQVERVKTVEGDIAADSYVLSLGSYSSRFVRPLGLRLPIYPVKGYSVTIPTTGYNGAPRVSISDESRKIVISRLGDRLRAAGTAELAGYDVSANLARSGAVLDALMAIFPNGGDAAKAEFWTGLRPMTPDGAPILGRAPLSNLYLNTGHGTLGWTTAAGSGQILADIIAGRPPVVDLTGLTLERF